MTISTFQVDTVLRAYNKQLRTGGVAPSRSENSERYEDIVNLSKDDTKKEAYEKITYSLLDIISNIKGR